MDPVASYNIFLQERQKKSLRRYLPAVKSGPFLNYAHNDYMSLSDHPALVHAGTEALHRWGLSGGSSRVLQERIPVYEEFEGLLARTLGMKDALTFVSGYQANATALGALLDGRVLKAKPIVFCDRLIHASLYHALKLVGVIPKRYPHQDMGHLARLLDEYDRVPGPKFVVTESIFSMEGTITDVSALAELCARHEAFLFLDEAHALGVCGMQGYGLGPGVVNPEQTVLMGTFSKGVGCAGAYVAGPQVVMDYLTNACTGLIYTTAPSPVIMAGAMAAWELLPHLTQERARVMQSAQHLFEGIVQMGLQTSPMANHIIPIILGSNEVTLHAKEKLLAEGIQVSAIRPPTVPIGTARLRLGLQPNLSVTQVETTLKALETHVLPLMGAGAVL